MKEKRTEELRKIRNEKILSLSSPDMISGVKLMSKMWDKSKVQM
jgi:hypothetical protein